MAKCRLLFPALFLTGTLAACSSNEASEPVEQIVVREPGEAAVPSETPTEESGEDIVTQGKAAFATCVGCHVVEEGAASTAGPNLYGVVGRAAGAAEDFNYSEALKGAGITWSEAELDAYLANPAEKVPGTTMVAGAVSDADSRTAIFAYLSSLSGE